MQQVVSIKWCDHPGCQEDQKERFPQGQSDTHTIEFGFYVPGRGKKLPTLRVDMCEAHIQELRTFYSAMYKRNPSREG